MATLRRRKNVGKEGIWEIQFTDEYQCRRTITLSCRKYSERTARQLKDAVEVLIDKKINSDPKQHKPTQAWIEGATPEIREKLAKIGLCQASSRHTVKELWDLFLNKYEFRVESTRQTYLIGRKRFDMFFTKPNELIVKLTKDRMEEWKAFLLTSGKYGQPTVAGTIRKAKTVFNWAKDQKWIEKSPLEGVSAGSFRNKANDREITMDEFHKLLVACPCQEWRTIITLARIGGLRPCEILVLRWSDIGVGKNGDRFRVFSPKLNPHEHLREREVALFPKVLEELNRLRVIPGNENQEYIINRYSNRVKVDLVSPFGKISERAGIGKIIRPFDNMRASRATEVVREYGAQAESVWLGHSKEVAKESYLMVTDDDYTKAAGEKIVESVDEAESGHSPEDTQGKSS